MALLVTAAALLSALLLMKGGAIPFTSDQAIPVLMAREILRGARPVFYWGVEYGGALEPHLLALLMSTGIHGEPAVRVLTALLLCGTVGTMALILIRGRTVESASLGLLYLAVAPVYLLYKILTSDGAYASMMLFGALAMSLVVDIGDPAQRPRTSQFLALGGALGVLLWLHLASAPFVVSSVPAVVREARRHRLGRWHVAGLVLGAAGGSSAWWIRNLSTNFASLRLPEAGMASLRDWPGRCAELARAALPVLFGPSSFRGVSSPGFVGWLILLAVGALILGSLRGQKATDDRSRGISRVGILLTVTSLGALLVGRNTVFWEPRYGLPALLGVSMLLGSQGRIGPRRWWLALAATTLLFTGGLSRFLVPPLKGFQRSSTPAGERGTILFVEPGAILAALDDVGIHDIYGSYWTVYRLVALSDGRLRGAAFGRLGTERIPSMKREVDRSENPGFVLEGADLEDFLGRWRLVEPGLRTRRAGGVTLAWGLSIGALAEIRGAGQVQADRVE